ncbi:MAG: Gfo/Idh/MocA family oxidoreductase, partial [Bacteroidetes bacterium]|nr:Gfo/Idh/MocA family oxidoreductase [Bacteroidota bacterium]
MTFAFYYKKFVQKNYTPNPMTKTLTTTLIILLFSIFSSQAQNEPRLRIGVVGLTHDHVHGILGRPDKGDIEIVGLVESNRELAERLCKRYQLSTDLIYPTIEAMVAAKQPEAVSVFTDIYAHAEVVEYCAPLGIHVMVEKPMAVNMKHALRMEK